MTKRADDYGAGYDAGYTAGYEDGYDRAYADAVKEYDMVAMRLRAELEEMTARVAALERQF